MLSENDSQRCFSLVFCICSCTLATFVCIDAMIPIYYRFQTHPTLSEVIDEAFKGAVGMSSH